MTENQSAKEIVDAAISHQNEQALPNLAPLRDINPVIYTAPQSAWQTPEHERPTSLNDAASDRDNCG